MCAQIHVILEVVVLKADNQVSAGAQTVLQSPHIMNGRLAGGVSESGCLSFSVGPVMDCCPGSTLSDCSRDRFRTPLSNPALAQAGLHNGWMGGGAGVTVLLPSNKRFPGCSREKAHLEKFDSN